MLPGRLEIHGILNSRKEVCEIHFGLHYNHFKDACDHYDHWFRIRGGETYDMVVASAGGYPRDINYIQAHKSIHNAASFVRDGGTLVILAECRDGIGNQAFLDLFALGSKEAIFREMERDYRNNAGTALATLGKAGRISIRFVTLLDAQTCSMMGMHRTLPEEARQLVESATGRVAWIENASLLYK
jgi:nickel-dependent lactate racemase